MLIDAIIINDDPCARERELILPTDEFLISSFLNGGNWGRLLEDNIHKQKIIDIASPVFSL